MRTYILNGREPAPCDDMRKWGEWMQSGERRVAESTFGHIWVSTVFLGLDHSFRPGGPPVLFETMVFIDGDGDSMWRYSTYADAEAGHQRIAEILEADVARAERMTGDCLLKLKKRFAESDK